MSDVVIFDTSILVDQARTGRHCERIESVEGVIRLSSVVLAELLRGVSGPAELKFLRTLARNHPVLDSDAKGLAGIWQDVGQNPCRSRLRAA
jgi:predicted nucleic acid-binding protein